MKIDFGSMATVLIPLASMALAVGVLALMGRPVHVEKFVWVAWWMMVCFSAGRMLSYDNFRLEMACEPPDPWEAEIRRIIEERYRTHTE